ncbi:hypothetical protein [Flavobacterium granuli]|uniref:Uncharacterized protein n=1 Tax=Flavobacterium granuli TaxID=280093 RepID=A0ABU1S2U1_9FLAO|nr:hypothetical protein [Flavobacterium granuli]MDR6844505.1 hypothetical protein [Flavobacterium granuli]
MKFKIMAGTVALLNALFGSKELPIDAENKQLNLDEAQRQKIVDALGEKDAEKAINGINSEIKAMADQNLILKAAKDELDALVLESGLTAEELANAANDGEGNDNVLAIVKTIAAKNKEMAGTINKLLNESEGDKPLAVIPGGKAIMKHSATHLFGSNNSYDAFEGGRAWNARMRDGGVTATDFNQSGVIPLLQSDLEHFVEENNGTLTSLFNDFRDLPSQWSRRTGVLDRVSDGFIMPDEIVQGRAKGWSPKNKFKIASERGQVYRKKIDISFKGYELQEMETTWIRSYNKADGSNPWKMSFIGFLLGELIKRQMLDDRIAQINGIYAESPDGDDVPGAAVNSQNGLRYLWYYYRDVEKKYRAFDIGAPTEANIVDHINTLIELMPEIERKEQGLEIQLSSRWLKAYLKRAGELRPLVVNSAIEQSKVQYQSNSPLDYPNFIFQELIDQTKTDFIAITKSSNVEILDYNVNEKGKFTITHNKRDTDIFADYRLGIRLKQVGTKLEAGDPRSFEIQKVWSNNMPVFGNEVFAPAFDDQSGILKITFPNIEVDSAWKTNITSIEGATKGSVIRIKGNTGLAAAKNLVNNANLLLASDFNLALGGTIVLFAQEDGKFKELSRTIIPDVAATTDISFTTGVIDSKGGNVFRFTGAVTTAITSILNGVEGKTIKIYGTNAAAVDLTFADVVGNINVIANATLGDTDDYMQLTFVNGVWVETGKSITA